MTDPYGQPMLASQLELDLRQGLKSPWYHQLPLRRRERRNVSIPFTAFRDVITNAHSLIGKAISPSRKQSKKQKVGAANVTDKQTRTEGIESHSAVK